MKGEKYVQTIMYIVKIKIIFVYTIHACKLRKMYDNNQ